LIQTNIPILPDYNVTGIKDNNDDSVDVEIMRLPAIYLHCHFSS